MVANFLQQKRKFVQRFALRFIKTFELIKRHLK